MHYALRLPNLLILKPVMRLLVLHTPGFPRVHPHTLLVPMIVMEVLKRELVQELVDPLPVPLSTTRFVQPMRQILSHLDHVLVELLLAQLHGLWEVMVAVTKYVVLVLKHAQ